MLFRRLYSSTTAETQLIKQLKTDIIKATNLFRVMSGLNPLESIPFLNESAQNFTDQIIKDQAYHFAELKQNPNTINYNIINQELKYKYCDENIFISKYKNINRTKAADLAFKYWQSNYDCLVKIINPIYNYVGVGVGSGEYMFNLYENVRTEENEPNEVYLYIVQQYGAVNDKIEKRINRFISITDEMELHFDEYVKDFSDDLDLFLKQVSLLYDCENPLIIKNDQDLNNIAALQLTNARLQKLKEENKEIRNTNNSGIEYLLYPHGGIVIFCQAYVPERTFFYDFSEKLNKQPIINVLKTYNSFGMCVRLFEDKKFYISFIFAAL
ncbi:hypothetical protein CDIK_1597 [Cucumispora dikerogammari]|nr:hypothetical protein CDIK_1597 [Cucumispora dikerogammari]